MHICKLDTPYIYPISLETTFKYFLFACDIIQNSSTFASKYNVWDIATGPQMGRSNL